MGEAVKGTGGFAAILPTFNRAGALRINLPGFLALRGLLELVVVNDASTDDTEAVLQTVADGRLRVITHKRNQGSPLSRQDGIAHSTAEWILMLEDDCSVAEDYGDVLMTVASELKADIVGAPWVHASEDRLLDEVAFRRAHPTACFRLDTPHGAFPAREVETPFLPALTLTHRSVFARTRYDEGYGGNAWREETAFVIAANQAGFRSVLTPRTFSYQTHVWDGGQKRSRLGYEFWAIRNNWRFLRRYGRYLHENGFARPPLAEQAEFVLGRLRGLVVARLTKRR